MLAAYKSKVIVTKDNYKSLPHQQIVKGLLKQLVHPGCPADGRLAHTTSTGICYEATSKVAKSILKEV